MAINVKISEMVELTTPGAGDMVPIVNTGSTKKITVTNLTQLVSSVPISTGSDGDVLTRGSGITYDWITPTPELPIDGDTDQVLSKVDGTSGNVQWSYLPADELPIDGDTDQVLSKVDGTSGNVQWSDLPADELPVAGTTGQVLSKVDGTSGNVQWVSSGLPTGGAVGEVLAKSTVADYDVEWVEAAAGGGGGGGSTAVAFTGTVGEAKGPWSTFAYTFVDFDFATRKRISGQFIVDTDISVGEGINAYFGVLNLEFVIPSTGDGFVNNNYVDSWFGSYHYGGGLHDVEITGTRNVDDLVLEFHFDSGTSASCELAYQIFDTNVPHTAIQ